MRVCEGGKVTHHIKVSTKAYACMLGGPDGRSLFVLTAETISPAGFPVRGFLREKKGQAYTFHKNKSLSIHISSLPSLSGFTCK
jgi:sugar lactone lactonase YvrE